LLYPFIPFPSHLSLFRYLTISTIIYFTLAGAPGSSGGGGGIAAKLGMGSNVKKAEASDKTFQVICLNAFFLFMMI